MERIIINYCEKEKAQKSAQKLKIDKIINVC